MQVISATGSSVLFPRSAIFPRMTFLHSAAVANFDPDNDLMNV